MKRRRIISFAAALALMFAAVISASGSAFAASGDVAGKIYSTDILAYINGSEVPSYNIGGRTVVVVEDICDFYVGISAAYDDSQRLLTVVGEASPKKDTHFERGTVGRVLGDVYETDIKVLFNGSYVTGYNIGGRTAVCLEDVGNIYEGPNTAYGYSKYAARAEWNADERIISLDFMGSFPYDARFTDEIARYILYFNDNTITASFDEMNPYYSRFGTSDDGNTFNNTPAFAQEKCVIKPLYIKYGDTTEEIGLCCVDANGYTMIRFNDMDSLVSKLDAYANSQKKARTFDEVVSMFDDKNSYSLIDRVDAEDFTLLVTKALAKTDEILYISVAKDGSFAVVYSSPVYEQMKAEKTDRNRVNVSVYPFAGPRGTTWMTTELNLEFYK
ncbi:MAG: hypothetical protein IIY69_08580 [Clostridia bacterium]|nr:hypothetical protein [Clostridia bacterium]